MAAGVPVASIGRRLGISERTVRRRLQALCARIGVASPIEAVVWAVRKDVI